MIILHHLNNSRSQRIIWLLEELGIDYEIKHYKRDPKTMLAPKELKEVHPMGKSPVLEDGDIKMAESGAIIEYLATTYGKNRFTSLNDEENRKIIYWLHFAEGSLMPQILLSLVFDALKKAPVPFLLKPIIKSIVKKVKSSYIEPEINLRLEHVNDHLKDHEWFAGKHLTSADFIMIFPLEAAEARGLLKDKFPNILSYVQKVQKMESYKKALEKGGPFSLS
ncbi:MAG: glutathione S-transferase [Bdellovibrionota bacterium]|nr:glutathione S-transferase [Bdellovibrionota bacterium]